MKQVIYHLVSADQQQVDILCADLVQIFDDNELDHKFLQTDESAYSLLHIILASSPYLTGIMRNYPAFALACFHQNPDEIHAQLIAELIKACNEAESDFELMKHLRIAKQKIALCLAVWDLAGQWNQAQVTDVLSRFADLAIEIALEFLLKQAVVSGQFETDNVNTITRNCNLFIIAMGKHGAYELNYSSDIDLIVFFRPRKIQSCQWQGPI